MDKKTSVLLLVLLSLTLLVLSCVSPRGESSAISNYESIANSISGKVFEVVVKKVFDTPETAQRKREQSREREVFEDSFRYQKELPWSTIPYSIRVDEYLSLGTAFAIAPNRFVTAAHVVSLEQKSLWNDYFLRDMDGNLYPLNNIYKYANDRDFISFDLKTEKTFPFLKFQPDFQVNQPVYSVGNALGEGIVIRDGTLTSVTPEEQNGEWKFLRFTAAASPGNSGGPLLNNKGEVVGIIVRRSENENLNYALPISEFQEWEEGRGQLSQNILYRLRIINDVVGPTVITKEYSLPMEYHELNTRLFNDHHEFYQTLIAKLAEDEADHLFPFGEGSYNLLFRLSSYYLDFPHIAVEDEAGKIWDVYRPKEIQVVDLEKNGYIQHGGIWDLEFFSYRRPENVANSRLYSDSKYFLDELLKGYVLNRTFGNQSVRITSMGAATSRSILTDSYGRKWIKQAWDVPFGNSQLLLYTIPVPSGHYTIGILTDINSTQSALALDLEFYLDYMTFSYFGSVQEWRNFMDEDMKPYHPAVLQNIQIDTDTSSFFTFRSPDFTLNFDDSLFDLQENTHFILKTSFEIEGSRAQIVPAGAIMYETRNFKDYWFITKVPRPHESLPSGAQAEWSTILEEKSPFNRSVLTREKESYVYTLASDFRGLSQEDQDRVDTLFTLGLEKVGVGDDEIMFEHLNKLEEVVEIHHNSAP